MKSNIDLAMHRVLAICVAGNGLKLNYTILKHRISGQVFAHLSYPSGRSLYLEPPRQDGAQSTIDAFQAVLDRVLHLYCDAEGIALPSLMKCFPPDGTAQEQFDWLVQNDAIEINGSSETDPQN